MLILPNCSTSAGNTQVIQRQHRGLDGCDKTHLEGSRNTEPCSRNLPAHGAPYGQSDSGIVLVSSCLSQGKIQAKVAL